MAQVETLQMELLGLLLEADPGGSGEP